MPLHPVDLRAVEADLIPQAIIKLPVETARSRFRAEDGIDDFDEFVGFAFSLEREDELFTVKHYQGHPADTFTIYMDPKGDDVARIAARVFRIVGYLDLPREAVLWERSQDPEL